MNSEERKKLVEARAYALSEEAGKPQSGDLMYWLIAEQELDTLSVPVEEDLDVAVDDLRPDELANRR